MVRPPSDSHDDVPWRDVVFVCTKCMKRQDRESLRDDLKRALKASGTRDVRVVASGCLDLCPKDAVTIAIGRELAGGAPRMHALRVQGQAAATHVEALLRVARMSAA
ncbi:hypothetical protein ACQQ2N_12660 [Dokdonella sp. MW10]|uniref:hypothetical protein n=1 Tax=Dokdonella sp. MW10 TaxID=2992926 RepID=UPI003F81B9BB